MLRRNSSLIKRFPFGPVFIGLLLLSGILAVSCAQTPQQQKEKAPAKSCLDCHPEMTDRFKQGYVHAPVQENRCDKCHLPHGLIGVVILRLEEPALCYTCHQALLPAAEQRSVHKPVATGQCGSCHDPHNSKYPSLLKTSREETCFGCHDRSSFTQKYVHAPLEKGCETCHNPHKSDNPSLLVMEADALCLSCHQAEQEGFIQAHRGYPVRSGCLQCHTPHSGNREKLLKKNIHQPVDRGECNSCHMVNKEVISTKNTTDRLCLDCHDKPAADRKSSHQPYLEERCTSCHLVHASDDPLLLAAPEEMICLTCHKQGMPPEPEKPKSAQEDTKSETGEKGPVIRSTHEPVKNGLCIQCHNGHDSQQERLLKQDPRTLCFTCHDKAVFTDITNSHPADPEKSCATCHKPHESENSALLINEQAQLCFSCHRKEAEERGRLSLHQPFAVGNCTGCHSLHGAAEKHYLKKANRDGALCAECHKKNREDESIRPHKPVAQGQCEQCHAAHSADYSFIMKEKPGKLCLSCHQDVGAVLRQVTVPHRPAVQEDCIACHAAHGSPHEHILKKGQPMLCLSCHRETAQYWQSGQSHQPAVSNCMECHTPHGSDQPGMLNSSKDKLCSRCHKITGEQFLAAHKNIAPGTESCVNCHDAHGGPGKGLLYPVGHAPFEDGTCKPCHSGRSK